MAKMQKIHVYNGQTADRILKAGRKTNRRIYMEEYMGLRRDGGIRHMFTIYYSPLQ